MKNIKYNTNYRLLNTLLLLCCKLEFGIFIFRIGRQTNVAADSGGRLVNTRRSPSPLNLAFGRLGR